MKSKLKRVLSLLFVALSLVALPSIALAAPEATPAASSTHVPNTTPESPIIPYDAHIFTVVMILCFSIGGALAVGDLPFMKQKPIKRRGA